MTHFNGAFQMLTSSCSQNGADHMTKCQEQTFAPPWHVGYLEAAGGTIFLQTCAIIFREIAPILTVPQKGSSSMKHRRRRRITFLIYGRKKCIVIETGAAIVLLGSSSCKSQPQQLIKGKRNLMTKKLKTKKSNKSWSPHLMGHKNLGL